MQSQVQDDFLGNVINLGDRMSTVELAAVNDAVPIGSIISWPFSSALLPSNWALIQGQAIDRVTYGALFSLTNNGSAPFGVGDGATTFTLPDYSRGVGNSIVDISYVEFTTGVGISATTEATANTVVTAGAVTCNGTDAYWIEFFSPQWIAGSSANYLAAVLYDGASSVGILGVMGSTGAQDYTPAPVRRRLTPSAGSHTYSIRGFISGGANGQFSAQGGGAGVQVPGYINVSCVPTTSPLLAMKVA